MLTVVTGQMYRVQIAGRVREIMKVVRCADAPAGSDIADFQLVMEAVFADHAAASCLPITAGANIFAGPIAVSEA
jgi:hypothetical protein